MTKNLIKYTVGLPFILLINLAGVIITVFYFLSEWLVWFFEFILSGKPFTKSHGDFLEILDMFFIKSWRPLQETSSDKEGKSYEEIMENLHDIKIDQKKLAEDLEWFKQFPEEEQERLTTLFDSFSNSREIIDQLIEENGGEDEIWEKIKRNDYVTIKGTKCTLTLNPILSESELPPVSLNQLRRYKPW